LAAVVGGWKKTLKVEWGNRFAKGRSTRLRGELH
jgi:hypothetical protein